MNRTKKLLYQKIEDYLISSINNRELKEGQSLPSERVLAKKFNSSHIPVRQATENLIDKGLLYKVSGKGTFVNTRLNPAPTNRLGIIYTYRDIDFYNSPTHSMLLAGIDAGAKRAGKDLLMRSLPIQDEVELSSFITSLEDDVDGMVLVDATQKTYRKIEETLQRLATPTVVVFYEGTSDDLDYITADSRGDTQKVMDFFFESGHRRIACLYRHDDQGNEIKPSVGNRISMYREALVKKGFTIDEDLIKRSDPESPGLYLEQWMALAQPPTAIFCTTSNLALSLYPQAEKLGVAIPEDISVIGYDDTRECALLKPPLSLVQLPLFDMGSEAVRRVTEKIQEKKEGRVTHRKTVIPGKLLLRGSHK